MKKTYNMAIGEQMAERIKIEIGSAAPHGRRRADHGSPRPRHDQRPAAQDDGHRRGNPRGAAGAGDARSSKRSRARSNWPSPNWPRTWSTTASRWPADQSLLRGLTTVISNATGLDVRLAEDPLTCVARGHERLSGEPRALERHDGEGRGRNVAVFPFSTGPARLVATGFVD